MLGMLGESFMMFEGSGRLGSAEGRGETILHEGSSRSRGVVFGGQVKEFKSEE